MSERIMITGGAGFIGSHLVKYLLENTDYEIVILDRLNYAGDLRRLTQIKPDANLSRLAFVWHDLRSAITDNVAQQIGHVNYIVHLAAESHVDRSLDNSLPFVESNVVGTANLLEYIRAQVNKGYMRPKVLVFSTDEVFGPAPDGVYYREDDRFRPSNPYAAAKAGEEMLAFSFAHAFYLDISISRCMNVFGEAQHEEKFLPRVIKQILDDDIITLHGSGPDNQSSRCWIYARDVAQATMMLVNKAEPGEFYHIVGEEWSVLDIAKEVYHAITDHELDPKRIKWIDFHAARPGHDKRYAMAGDKLKDMGWKAETGVMSGIRQVCEWYMNKRT
jgi:dTDP-glucose 4,6-dehydratase